MKAEKITEESIRGLVDGFYAKVRLDEFLGPIFAEAFTEKKGWQSHLPKMYDFWSSVMLGTSRYRGNPFQKHFMLPPFDSQLFDRWLALFKETLFEIYVETIADQFIEKSERIAGKLKYSLDHVARRNTDENPPSRITSLQTYTAFHE